MDTFIMYTFHYIRLCRAQSLIILKIPFPICVNALLRKHSTMPLSGMPFNLYDALDIFSASIHRF